MWVMVCVLVCGFPTDRNAMLPTYAGRRHTKSGLMTKSERITVANTETLPDLTDYPKRLAQLNDLFGSREESWDSMDRELLIYYLTTMLLWHELERPMVLMGAIHTPGAIEW